MASKKIKLDVWQDREGLTALCRAGDGGKECRDAMEGKYKIIFSFFASSHYEAMTKYYEFMDWGEYTTEFEIDKEPFKDLNGELQKEIILNSKYNFRITLHLSKAGFCYCPVCGLESQNKDWRPYDENGIPSHDICRCGYQFGYNDEFPGPYDKTWEIYREKWLNGDIKDELPPVLTLSKKKKQLGNINIFIE